MSGQCWIIPGVLLFLLAGCAKPPQSSPEAPGLPISTADMIKVKYKRYANRVELNGGSIIALAMASHDSAKTVLPFLVEAAAMSEREFIPKEVTATTTDGGIADEVHEFLTVKQGNTQTTRLLLRDSKVIELQVGAVK